MMELKFFSFTLFLLFAAFGSIETTWSSGPRDSSSSWPTHQGNYNTYAPSSWQYSTPPPYNRPVDTRVSDSWLTHSYGRPNNSSRPNPQQPQYRPGGINGRPADTRDSDAWLSHNYGQPTNSSRFPQPQYRPGGSNGRPADTRDSDAWLSHNYGHPDNSSRFPQPQYRPGGSNGRPANTRDSDAWLSHHYGQPNNSSRPNPSWPQRRPEDSNGRWETRSGNGVRNNSERLYPSLAYFQPGNSSYQNGRY